jgi:hypothetical protein
MRTSTRGSASAACPVGGAGAAGRNRADRTAGASRTERPPSGGPLHGDADRQGCDPHVREHEREHRSASRDEAERIGHPSRKRGRECSLQRRQWRRIHPGERVRRRGSPVRRRLLELAGEAKAATSARRGCCASAPPTPTPRRRPSTRTAPCSGIWRRCAPPSPRRWPTAATRASRRCGRRSQSSSRGSWCSRATALNVRPARLTALPTPCAPGSC